MKTTRKLGTTTIVATHNYGILKIAERIIELRDGEVIEDRRVGGAKIR